MRNQMQKIGDMKLGMILRLLLLLKELFLHLTVIFNYKQIAVSTINFTKKKPPERRGVYLRKCLKCLTTLMNTWRRCIQSYLYQ